MKISNEESLCHIWKLKLFRNYLISGDSIGEITIWDSQFGTLIKKFNHLKGDILTLEISLDHNSVYATGIDSRIISL